TATTQATHTVASSIGQVVEHAVEQSATIIPQALLQALSQRAGKAAKDTDERPVLLARILATDTSTSLRRIAAWGLSEYADRQVAAEALANALRRDADASVREMAAWSLAEVDRSHVGVEALSAALRSDGSTQVRATSAWALGNVGDRSSASALAAALSDANVEVHNLASCVLGNSVLHQAAATCIAFLSDKDPV